MAGIHTLNARGNVMLPALREHYAWTDSRAFHEIQRFHGDLLDVLRAKGIDYSSLRTALTPQPMKHEAAFLFDEQRCENTFVPGVECADALFTALDRKTTHSILGGELIDDRDVIARALLRRSANIAKDLDFKHPCFCYVLYVNNLSKGNVASIDSKLRAHKAYLGYVPCTHASLAKTFVSMHLVNLVIKQGDTVILGHEDDRPNTENHNLHLHDYTALGLRQKSLQSMYFDVFLSYKPEWMMLEESDDDLEIALRAMSEEVAPLTEFAVVIGDDKFEKYLKTAKLGKLEKAGLSDLTKAELEAAIREKLRMTYLYNMEWVDEPTHQLSKFNILLEFPRPNGHPERMVVALEYRPVERMLRLVTVS
ncbi:hypothetical protein FSO04_12035 [Paraburkholderia madseniana]|uniref:Uncharacterized protein n=1 Tax=Paraburkholderia madseniana TaxID=2599607 RepID=A0A6N6WHX9_9BURK|nr:hypothetical protein [Paraburkholderia madseniana]KAE8759629.1 hypothetical protein FSO04_12035 [Paraburkholderia madseniana]